MNNEIPTTLELKVGETVHLTLPGLATAGYRWSYEITQADAAIAVSAVSPDSSPIESDIPVGSSSDEHFEIRALKPGQAILRLVQRRSWEQQPPIAEHQIDIIVRSPIY